MGRGFYYKGEGSIREFTVYVCVHIRFDDYLDAARMHTLCHTRAMHYVRECNATVTHQTYRLCGEQ